MSSLTHDSSYSVSYKGNVIDLDKLLSSSVLDVYKVGKLIDEDKDVIQIGQNKYQGQNSQFFDGVVFYLLKKETKDKFLKKKNKSNKR